MYDPRKGEAVKFPDQTLTKELLRSCLIGSSRGWVVAKNAYDSTLRLTNMFNPSASASSRKVIPLPPTSDRLSRISLSASPDQEDCVVAALSTGSALSLCRPGDSSWTAIKTPFFTSEMIFSDRDGKFYLDRVRRKEEYDGPVDLIDTSSSGFPQVSLYQRFLLSDIPKTRLEQLSSTAKNEYIVESPSGESLVVYWCHKHLATRSKEPPYEINYKRKPRTFVVFRQDPEQRISSYTEDIGDLCIFLGGNEAFCVSATQYPGLKPNSVYFAGYDTGFGFYDLSSNTVHDAPPFPSCSSTWMAPLQ